MKYELDYGDGVLTCWHCGEDIDGGVLIEWRRGFKQEINCQKCYGELLHNEKDILVVAIIEPQHSHQTMNHDQPPSHEHDHPADPDACPICGSGHSCDCYSHSLHRKVIE